MTHSLLLKIGNTYKVSDSLNREYTIVLDLYKNHNHERKPLYHYNGEEKADDIVITIQNDDPPPYPSPYAGTIEKKWHVMRKNCILHFTVLDKTSVKLELEEK